MFKDIFINYINFRSKMYLLFEFILIPNIHIMPCQYSKYYLVWRFDLCYSLDRKKHFHDFFYWMFHESISGLPQELVHTTVLPAGALYSVLTLLARLTLSLSSVGVSGYPVLNLPTTFSTGGPNSSDLWERNMGKER